MRGKKKIDEERCQKIDSAERHEGHSFRSIKTTHKRSGFVYRVLRAVFQVDSQSSRSVPSTIRLLVFSCKSHQQNFSENTFPHIQICLLIKVKMTGSCAPYMYFVYLKCIAKENV